MVRVVGQTYDSSLYTRMSADSQLYLPQFDTISFYFYLPVGPIEELVVPIIQFPANITGPVTAGLPAVHFPEEEFFIILGLIFKVSYADAGPCNIQFTGIAPVWTVEETAILSEGFAHGNGGRSFKVYRMAVYLKGYRSDGRFGGAVVIK